MFITLWPNFTIIQSAPIGRSQSNAWVWKPNVTCVRRSDTTLTRVNGRRVRNTWLPKCSVHLALHQLFKMPVLKQFRLISKMAGILPRRLFVIRWNKNWKIIPQHCWFFVLLVLMRVVGSIWIVATWLLWNIFNEKLEAGHSSVFALVFSEIRLKQEVEQCSSIHPVLVCGPIPKWWLFAAGTKCWNSTCVVLVWDSPEVKISSGRAPNC